MYKFVVDACQTTPPPTAPHRKLSHASTEPSQLTVPQPSHRTISLDLKEDKTQELNWSLIGLSKEEHWADALQDKITLKTQIPIKIIGITQRKFLITFMSEEDKQDFNSLLDEWFVETWQVTQLDLVPPRLAWVYCDGLPFSMWNAENWNKILGDWGRVVNKNFCQFKCGMLQNSRICVETFQVIDIEETLKVIIGNKGYWVKIKESNICYEIEQMQLQYLAQRDEGLRELNSVMSSDIESEEDINEDTTQEEVPVTTWPELPTQAIPREQINAFSQLGSQEEMEQEGIRDVSISAGTIAQEPQGPNTITRDIMATHQKEKDIWPNSSHIPSPWAIRKDNDSSSDSNNQDPTEEGKQQHDLEAIQEEEEESWPSENEFAQKMERVTMGKRPGRPRKLPRVNHFFDYSRKINSRKTKKGGRKQLQTPREHHSKQETGNIKTNTTEPRVLVEEILESAQLMGLSLSSDRDRALQLIKEKLDNDAQTGVEPEQGEGITNNFIHEP